MPFKKSPETPALKNAFHSNDASDVTRRLPCKKLNCCIDQFTKSVRKSHRGYRVEIHCEVDNFSSDRIIDRTMDEPRYTIQIYPTGLEQGVPVDRLSAGPAGRKQEGLRRSLQHLHAD